MSIYRRLPEVGRWIHATSTDAANLIRKRGFSPRGGSHGPGIYAGTRPELVEPWIWQRRYGDAEAEALMGYIAPEDVIDLGKHVPSAVSREGSRQQRAGVIEALRGGKSAVIRNHPDWGDFYVLDPTFATRSLREFEADPANKLEFMEEFLETYTEGMERYLKNNPKLHVKASSDPHSPTLWEYLNRI